jgi:hypothetical protein
MGRQVSGYLFFLISHTVHPCPDTVRTDRANRCPTYHPRKSFFCRAFSYAPDLLSAYLHETDKTGANPLRIEKRKRAGAWSCLNKKREDYLRAGAEGAPEKTPENIKALSFIGVAM